MIRHFLLEKFFVIKEHKWKKLYSQFVWNISLNDSINVTIEKLIYDYFFLKDSKNPFVNYAIESTSRCLINDYYLNSISKGVKYRSIGL